MRIVLVIGSANAGGAEKQLVRLAAELTTRGHDIRVVFLSVGGPLTQVLDRAGVRWMVARVPLRHITAHGRNVLGIGRFARLLRTFDPDVIYTWLPGSVVPTTLAKDLGRCPAPVVVALRGQFESDRRNRRVTTLLRRALRRATLVSVNAPDLIPVAGEWGIDAERICFIPNGVDPSPGRAEVSRQPPTAVVVANFRWYKGHDVLIQALASADVCVVLRLLGEGEGRPAIANLAKELGLGDRVVFADYSTDVQHELLQAQFAIHPSLTEGMSNAILEQISAGLPVIATDVGATSLMIAPGVNGQLVPPGDVDALARAIREFATDAPLRERYAAASLIKAEDFAWATCVDRVEEMLARASAGRPG